MKNQYCTACLHRDVCIFKNDFMRAKTYIENELKETEIWVNLGSEHFTYELKCNHYLLTTPTPKNSRYDSGPGYRAKD